MSKTKVTNFPDGVVGVWRKGYNYKKYHIDLYKSKSDYKDRKKWKGVSFGDNRYEQYKDQTPLKIYKNKDHNDTSRLDNYRARHGAQGYQNNKYSPAWFSWNYLW